jgi:hypothetical protein
MQHKRGLFTRYPPCSAVCRAENTHHHHPEVKEQNWPGSFEASNSDADENPIQVMCFADRPTVRTDGTHELFVPLVKVERNRRQKLGLGGLHPLAIQSSKSAGNFAGVEPAILDADGDSLQPVVSCASLFSQSSKYCIFFNCYSDIPPYPPIASPSFVVAPGRYVLLLLPASASRA